jgi:hypothetical protein
MDMEIQNTASADYEKMIRTQEQALAHLYFHCCYNDNEFDEKEMDEVSAKFVHMGLNKDLNFKKEIKNYLSYKPSIKDDDVTYISYLISVISPVQDLALFSSCVDLSISDETLSLEDEELLMKIGKLMQIPDADQKVIRHLMMQKRIVRKQKFF